MLHTYFCRRYIHITHPYDRLFLVQISNICCKMLIPNIFGIKCLVLTESDSVVFGNINGTIPSNLDPHSQCMLRWRNSSQIQLWWFYLWLDLDPDAREGSYRPTKAHSWTILLCRLANFSCACKILFRRPTISLFVGYWPMRVWETLLQSRIHWYIVHLTRDEVYTPINATWHVPLSQSIPICQGLRPRHSIWSLFSGWQLTQQCSTSQT